jgi:uncharacterized protein YkwD
MRNRLAAVLVVAAACLAVVSPASAADDPLLAPPGTCAAADQLGLDQATAQQSMLCLTNFARTQSGLVALRLDTALNAAGQAKLAANVSCGEFSHTPCGTPFSTVFATYLSGARGYQIGENIAWGTGAYGTARQTMNGWLHSEGHRKNILTPEYRDLGIGYLPNQTFQGYTGAALWAQEFGTRTPSSSAATAPAPTPTPPAATPPAATPPSATPSPSVKKKPARKRLQRR